MGQRRHSKAGDCIFSMEENENHQLRTGFFVHYRIVSDVKRVEFLVIGRHLYSSESSLL